MFENYVVIRLCFQQRVMFSWAALGGDFGLAELIWPPESSIKRRLLSNLHPLRMKETKERWASQHNSRVVTFRTIGWAVFDFKSHNKQYDNVEDLLSTTFAARETYTLKPPPFV